MPRKQHRRASDISKDIIDAIVATKPKSKSLSTPKETERFLRKYFADVPYEDMQGRSTDIMGQAAMAHLDFGRVRKSGKPLLRIFNPNEQQHGYQSAYTIVEMVNDNMPFLVDSVAAAIDRQGLAIQMTIHPLLKVQRDGRGRLLKLPTSSEDVGQVESFIRFVLQREPAIVGAIVRRARGRAERIPANQLLQAAQSSIPDRRALLPPHACRRRLERRQALEQLVAFDP